MVTVTFSVFRWDVLLKIFHFYSWHSSLFFMFLLYSSIRWIDINISYFRYTVALLPEKKQTADISSVWRWPNCVLVINTKGHFVISIFWNGGKWARNNKKGIKTNFLFETVENFDYDGSRSNHTKTSVTKTNIFRYGDNRVMTHEKVIETNFLLQCVENFDLGSSSAIHLKNGTIKTNIFHGRNQVITDKKVIGTNFSLQCIETFHYAVDTTTNTFHSWLTLLFFGLKVSHQKFLAKFGKYHYNNIPSLTR